MTTVASGWLRIDRSTWIRLVSEGSLSSVLLVAMGAFGVLAVDRFGFQLFFVPRATVRLLLFGFYGWLALAGATWLVGRLVFPLVSGDVRFGDVFRCYGYAHLPLLAVGIVLQVASIGLGLTAVGRVAAFVGVLVWMPALLMAATQTLFRLDTGRATVVVAVPFLGWLLVVGRHLSSQLGHLL